MKNDHKTIISIVFTILLVTVNSYGVFAQNSIEWQELETKHFIIMHYGLDESTLSMIAEEAENAYDKVTSDFRYHPDNKTVIQIGHIDDNPKEDKWLGSYSIGFKIINLLSSTQKEVKRWDNYESYIEEAIIHEFTHHILSEGYRLGFPDWLNEGIATYEAGKKPEHLSGYIHFRKAATKDELLPLGKMGIFDLLEEDERNLAYIESYTVIEYIVDTYGHDKLVEILKAKRENKHMDQITDEVLGVSYEEFKVGWMKFVKEKYGKPSFFIDLYDTFYLIITALLLRKGILIWTQKKRN